ncbi:hypothetical protein [Pelagicoccus sp. SDUM812005]|uniref:hypothetical protein n=1 Tax=Pelagicoccus sp. SDUM812005 TaxID=3041257 RepID=UPI00280E572D|nr:hypothetical protein [Pelagicoccus sp. SDUM812005]MDQ8182311.1 hypothetical protein [Pelagicoccus sp. SDUM812005]
MSMQPSFRTTNKNKKFLGVRFASCNCYGRLYLNDDGGAYVGRCPKCYTSFAVRVGAGGTSSRMFVANCR